MSNAAMKLNETSSDAYEKLEALLSPDVIKLKHYVDKGEYLLVLGKVRISRSFLPKLTR
ncbi:hypothetical protein Q5585_22700 [Escherichia coli]|nr:hypothetical protein [Escherichia coli]